MGPSLAVPSCLEIFPLILTHFDALLNSLSKYFLLISVDQYNWVRNPSVEFEPCQRQFTLKEEEEFVSIASDRMLKLKQAELNLDAFWLLVCLLQFSTSYHHHHHSDFLLWPPSNTRNENDFCLSKMNFVSLSRTFGHKLNCFVEITKHKFRTEMFATANWCYG